MIAKLEDLIKNKYHPRLLDAYKNTIRNVKDCYYDESLDLQQAKDCAEKHTYKY